MCVNTDDVSRRLHDRSFPRGFIDIPPVAQCPEGVSLPAKLFRRNASKWWLWRADHPNAEKARVVLSGSKLSMKEIRALAAEKGLKIPVGMSKYEAIKLVEGQTDETD